VSSDDLKTLQQDTFAAIQRLIAQSPSMAALQRSPSIAAMQLQLAQGQFRTDGTSPGEVPAIGDQFLVFSLADREFAVKADMVQGVERLADLTLVPHVASWIKGVMNLRGSIVSVVDLRAFLGLEPSPYSPRTRVLSLQSNELVICFIVDGVSEMLPIPAPAIIRENVRQAAIPPWAISYATGSALVANRVMVILDVARLLFSEKMQNYASRPYDN
jgi:purine-binding chemotaxis protein CheW